MTFLIHLLITYGGARETTTAKGGLSPWQLRRAKNSIEAHLFDNVALESLFLESVLSPGHFACAFASPSDDVRTNSASTGASMP